jgi:hypothetical protein
VSTHETVDGDISPSQLNHLKDCVGECSIMLTTKRGRPELVIGSNSEACNQRERVSVVAIVVRSAGNVW